MLDGNGQAAASVSAVTSGSSTQSLVSQSITDTDGRNAGSVDPNGKATQTQYDSAGNVVAVTDPDGNTTRYLYNSQNQQTEAIDPTGTITTTTYNSNGQVSSVTDRDGRMIQYSYDNNGREKGEVWLSSASVTVNLVTYTSDNAGNLLTAADDNGTVTYTYDSLERQQSYPNVFGQVLTYSYNAANEVTLRTDSLGGVLTSAYDPAGQLTTREFSGTGSTGTAVRVDFGYDARGDQTTITWSSNLAGTAVVAQGA